LCASPLTPTLPAHLTPLPHYPTFHPLLPACFLEKKDWPEVVGMGVHLLPPFLYTLPLLSYPLPPGIFTPLRCLTCLPFFLFFLQTRRLAPEGDWADGQAGGARRGAPHLKANVVVVYGLGRLQSCPPSCLPPPTMPAG